MFQRISFIFATLFFTGACAAPLEIHPGEDGRPEIRVVRLKWSNVHIIAGKEGPVLVDAGSPVDEDFTALRLALKDMGKRPSDIQLIILTHGHGDHAGGARRLRRESGAPIMMGAGDTGMAAAGKNKPLKTMSLMARMLKPFVDFPYPKFQPDVLIAPGKSAELTRYGLEGRVVSTPGHTDGSLVVVLPGGDAFVGDMVLGGYMGGGLLPASPGRHYFHDDAPRAENHLRELLRNGTKRFYPGHGGPITARAMRKWLN